MSSGRRKKNLTLDRELESFLGITKNDPIAQHLQMPAEYYSQEDIEMLRRERLSWWKSKRRRMRKWRDSR